PWCVRGSLGPRRNRRLEPRSGGGIGPRLIEILAAEAAGARSVQPLIQAKRRILVGESQIVAVGPGAPPERANGEVSQACWPASEDDDGEPADNADKPDADSDQNPEKHLRDQHEQPEKYGKSIAVDRIGCDLDAYRVMCGVLH